MAIRLHGKAGGAVLATVAVLFGVAGATPAGASPGPVYFRIGDAFNCSIGIDGSVGCDLPGPPMSYVANTTLDGLPSLSGSSGAVPLPIPRSIVIDGPGMPAHPLLSLDTPHTLPGGNPDIRAVATEQTKYGATIAAAGAVCQVAFYDNSFACLSKGRKFTHAPVWGGLGPFFAY